jgi:hypothetical protein
MSSFKCAKKAEVIDEQADRDYTRVEDEAPLDLETFRQGRGQNRRGR